MKPLIGSFAALPTPFKNGAFDQEAYVSLIEHLVENGTNGLVPIGTTGEAATLSPEEQLLVVKTAVNTARGRVPVIAGAGTFSTITTIDGVRRVREAGADAALVVTPYYNKPTQDGLVAHYRSIAQAHPRFPILAYNVPGRTSVDLLPDTCLRLCDISEVVGIKEATGSMVRITDIVERCGDRLTLLSGDDFTVAPFIALGGKGVISVSANAAPRLMSDLVSAALKGDFKTAAQLQVKLNPLHRALFLETSPIPLKMALHVMGRCQPEMRSPLTTMTEGACVKLRQALQGLGLVS